jgi:hypothetical protein
MKKLIAVIGVAFIATITHAQTGQAVADFVFTNSAVDFEGLRGLTGNKYITALTYAKDITTSNDVANAGLLVTYDRCFSPHNTVESESDQLTGGFTLKTSVYPFRHWSPNSQFRLDISAYAEGGTITSGKNNGNPITIVGTRVGYEYKSLEVGVLYQHRTEDDDYQGNYVGVDAGWRF